MARQALQDVSCGEGHLRRFGSLSPVMEVNCHRLVITVSHEVPHHPGFITRLRITHAMPVLASVDSPRASRQIVRLSRISSYIWSRFIVPIGTQPSDTPFRQYTAAPQVALP